VEADNISTFATLADMSVQAKEDSRPASILKRILHMWLRRRLFISVGGDTRGPWITIPN